MLFNSFGYLLFFPIVCIIYWMLPNKYRNIFLLIASYFFYMNWEPVYGLLIIFSTLITWLCGIFLDKGKDKKKKILVICVLINLGILFVFKYANFVSDTFNNLFSLLHIKFEISFLKFLLPVGISFYTFQAIGYTIDVYNGKIKAERNFATYALFVSFFPQLVAGPIERAKNLLPQFHRVHQFSINNFTEGVRLILWGYFMKIVVSDRLAIYVNSVYDNINQHSSISLILATVFFSFQIYCDFGGYSNIAVGCAKVMGFDLITNFNRPYLATSVIDFWRRWHISLSTWFKDYLYIPLGGNRCSKRRNYVNILVTFVLSGIWHGANWTFIIWGFLNGFFQVIDKMTKSSREKIMSFLRITKYARGVVFLNIVFTFILVTMTWVFFRADTVSNAFRIFGRILFNPGHLFLGAMQSLIYGSVFTILLILSDIMQEKNNGKHFLLENKHAVVRYISYILIIIIILMFGVFDSSQFIYFQF